MILLDNNSNNVDFSDGVGVTFGKFDGIHIGHMKLISTLKEMCYENNYKSMVYSFLQNPSNVINKANIKSIYCPRKKKQILENLGIDYLLLNDFDRYYAKTMPDDFIKTLVEKYNTKIIVAGYNSRFGSCRKGGLHELEHLCKKYNIMLKIISKVIYTKDDITYDVSSTLIREIISSGDIKLASELLGRSFSDF